MKMDVTSIADYKVIKLSGRVGWESANVLDKEINWLIQDGCKRMLFNLDEVSYICSGAMGAVLYNSSKFKSVGGGIYLISNNEYVSFIFKTAFGTMLDGIMFATIEEFEEKVLNAGDKRP